MDTKRLRGLAGSRIPPSATGWICPFLRLGLPAILALFSAGSSSAQTIHPDLWVTDGSVQAIVHDAGKIYIGGTFTQLGPATGGGVPLDATTGALPGEFPKVAGRVLAVAADGAGGWYIGGFFNAVGGLPRSNIAHVGSDLKVSAWTPEADNRVRAIAVSGTKVYVGGDFLNIGGQPRSRIAQLDGVDDGPGTATIWDPGADANVYAIVVSGSNVFVGGEFHAIGGQSRAYIAALNAATGAATSWNPSPDNPVVALTISGTTIYAGGYFHFVGGQSRSYLAGIGVATGTVIPWTPNPNSYVAALAVNGSTIIAGGDFTFIGGQNRAYIAEVDANGEATAWDPDANSTVNALAVSGSTVYVGGHFSTMRGQIRRHLAAVNIATGVPSSWDPSPTHDVYAIAVSGSTVYVGGQFVCIGGPRVSRFYLAALDSATGVPTSWDPSADDAVYALAIDGTTIYAGGDFTSVHGQAHQHVVAIDADTGIPTSWLGSANNAVYALAPAQLANGLGGEAPVIVAGGAFTLAGGLVRSHIAALDVATGGAKPWFPNANGNVRALAVTGDTIYAGGDFSIISGQPRSYVAALSGFAGGATAWDPGASGSVYALVPSGPVIYVGGEFYNIGGGGNGGGCVAAVDVATGLATTTFRAGVNNTVRAIAVSDSTVYVGGDFYVAGGRDRNCIVALDARTGDATSWNPNADAVLRALDVSGSMVYAGGDFTSIAKQATFCIVGIFAAPDVRVVQPSSGGNTGVVTVTVVGYNLQPGASVTLSRSGEPDIGAANIVVSPDARSITATLDLDGAAVGAWDVVVTNPDVQTATLSGGFTINEIEAPQLRVSVLGPPLIRADRSTSFDLVIENPGNVDALAVPLWITGLPLDATIALDFPLSAPPQAGGEPDWTTVPLSFTSPGGRYVPLVIPRVPPGTTVRRIVLTIPPTDPTFKLRASLSPPWVDGNVFRGCLTAGGVIGAPACMGAQLTAINGFLASAPQIEALSGIGVWAKIAWACEGAGTLAAALVKAEQVLDYMIHPIDQPGSAISSCSGVLPPRWRDSLLVTIVTSFDPNDKIGAQGTLPAHQAIPYSIRFENASTATAPAQQVVISDPLNISKLDPNSVSLDVITFGNVHIVPPPGLRSYATQVDLRPGRNLLVNVSAAVDPFTGVLTWYFSSIDPATGQPPTDPLAGFLPPNVTPPAGEGSVLFTVMPRPGLPSGTQISNGATITFDTNAPQTTPNWVNTVDNAPPASHVLPLPANSDLPTVAVNWTPDGAVQDLRDFTVYVAEDGAPYRVWRLNTAATTDTLVPPKNHQIHHYAFYSVARDASGNIEAPPVGPDAATQSRTAVGDQAPLRLALEGARPNPAMGAMRVWFTLPSSERATLELVDVAGRRVMRRDVGSLGPGPHSVALGESAVLRPGLYFLRLVQGPRVLSDRVAVIR